MAFFLCPKEDKVVRPHEDIIRRDGMKQYPDFTWSDLLEFTQKYYRADEATLHAKLHQVVIAILQITTNLIDSVSLLSLLQEVETQSPLSNSPLLLFYYTPKLQLSTPFCIAFYMDIWIHSIVSFIDK